MGIKMKVLLNLLLLGALSLAASPVAKIKEDTKKTATKLKIVTTMPVLKSLALEIGGDLIVANSLTTALEDPHFVKPKPTFKTWVSEADLFLQIGRSLELWVPLVINASGNTKLISGERLVTVSNGVKNLEVPDDLNRGKGGDIHPQGNPHIWLSPQAILQVAENIKNALVKIDGKNKTVYENNFKVFRKNLSVAMFGDEIVKAVAGNEEYLWRLFSGNRLTQYLSSKKKTVGGWLKRAAQIDYSFISYHTEFSYLASDFNLKIMGQVEEKSGVSPSIRYQNELAKKAQANKIKHIVAAQYYSGQGKLIDFIANKINGHKLFLAVDCLENEKYVDMINRILSSLVDFKGKVRTQEPVKLKVVK